MESTGSLSLDDETAGGRSSQAMLTTCAHCDKLHRAELLEFSPVCALCAAERVTMRSLEMKGSYPLSAEAIDAELTQKSPGNYALGYVEDDQFVVFYVGRSDSDLRRCLEDWVGAPSQYRRFAPSGMAAWRLRRRGVTPLRTPALGPAGSTGDSSYTHFAYSYATSAGAALEKEHRNYDDFGGRGGLDNERPPPERSVGAEW